MRFDPRRAVVRTVLATTLGFSVGIVLIARGASPAIAVLAGIVAGGALLLGLILSLLCISGADETQRRASRDDPGRTAVFSVMLNVSAIALFAATILVRTVRQASQGRALLVALCLATVALAWSLTHSTFALRYAHLYYRGDKEGGGVKFPGAARPAYSDFAYLAFTIGMCFQVSDASVTSPRIRRAVLLHAVMSFVYTTAILAFVLNLVFSLAS
jgi:uncharacterized membrane protein